MEDLRDLKEFCLNLYSKSKNKEVRKIMRKVDKIIKKQQLIKE